MPYFTTSELRALPDMGDAARFPDARLVDAHDWIVSIIERECGTSFIPVTVTETLTGTNGDVLWLRAPYVQSVSAVTVDGVAWAPSAVAALFVRTGGLYQAGARWPATSWGNVTVAYVSGYSTTPPPDLKQAALRAARNWVLTTDAWSGVDTRATSISNEYGNISLAVAGEGRPTGLPDIDATIMAWARRVRVPGVA